MPDPIPSQRATTLARPPVGPLAILAIVGAVLAVAWGLFLVVDAWNVGGLRDRFAAWTGGRISPALWVHLFLDRPVEWMQWLSLAVLAPTAGYLAGRLRSLGFVGASRFYAVLALAGGLLLIEDAGDVRHVISLYLSDLMGAETQGIHVLLSDGIYFAVLASVPLYGLLRYGRYVWRSRPTRPYLVVGYGLYGLASSASAISAGTDLYERIGGAFHRLLGGGIPVPPGMGTEGMYYRLTDRVLEESVELIAVTCLLATVAAFATHVASGTLPPEDAAEPDRDPDPALPHADPRQE